jgi:hypothetical protein
MADTFFIKKFWSWNLLPLFRFPEVDGSSVEESQVVFLVIASFIFVQTVK